MAALAKKNQWKLALELMEEMAEAGVEPDIISYNTAMHVCGKAGKWQTVRRRLDSTDLRSPSTPYGHAPLPFPFHHPSTD